MSVGTRPYATGQEYKVREDQNLLSRTDNKGRITYAAQAFVEVSGYSREELIGAPHSIVRHPDMPKEAFDNLWQSVSRGENWIGMVKNRRKNGDYYWVRAHVTPVIEDGKIQGYTSVRIKPTDEEIRSAEDIYAKIRAGNMRGFRFERGRIIKTGLSGFISRLNISSLKARISIALCINFALIFSSLLWMLHSKQLIDVPLQELAISDPAHQVMVAEVTKNLLFADYVQAGILGITALITAITFMMLFKIVRGEVRLATRFALHMAAGNMAVNKPEVTCKEFESLTRMLAVMQRSLTNISGEVRQSLMLVCPETEQIANSSDALAARTEQQAASLQETAASMEQITATVLQNTDNARQASLLAEAAACEVQQGGDAVHAVVNRMNAITESSNRITEIVSVIDSIAFQTNILALNASIEAARAGEQGRGFAVVAEEVRNLATRSANAAGEVRLLVQGCCDEITQGNYQVDKAEAAIAEVVTIVHKVNDIVGEIAAASEEQRRSIEQINIAVSQMDEATQRNSSMAVESSYAAHTMETQVAELANSIDVLRLPGVTEPLLSHFNGADKGANNEEKKFLAQGLNAPADNKKPITKHHDHRQRVMRAGGVPVVYHAHHAHAVNFEESKEANGERETF